MGLLAAKSIGRFSNQIDFGTGFHVGNQVLITNHHVIREPREASDWQFELNAEDSKFGAAKNLYSYSFISTKVFPYK